MKKGIVLELKKEYAVIGSEGSYKRVKRKDGMELGQEIIYLEEDVLIVKKETTGFSLQKLVPALSALVILMMIVFNYYTENLRIYAVVTVDINPSIELKLNKNQEVVEAIAINADAEKLDLRSFEGIMVEEVVEKIIESSKDEGFIAPDKKTYIMITTVNTRDQVETYDNIKATLETSIDLISIEENVNIGLGESTVELLEQAEATQVPLALLEVRDELDEDVDSVEDLFENQEVKAFIESQGKIVEVEVEFEDDGVEIEISIEDDLDDDLDDLLELLSKLSKIPEEEVEILTFVEESYKALDGENANVKELKDTAKGYWLSVKDLYDIDDDDDDLDDLLELLVKLSKVPEDEVEILAFVDETYNALDGENANIKELKDIAKGYWLSVKDLYDIDDDDDLDDLLEVMAKLEAYSQLEEVVAFITKDTEAVENETGNYHALEGEGEDLLDSIEDQLDDDNDMDELEDLLEVIDELDKYRNLEEVAAFITKAKEAVENETGNYDALEDEGEDLLDSIEDQLEDEDDGNDIDDEDDNDMDDDDMDDDDDNDMDDDDDNDMDDEDDNDMDDDDDNDMDDDDDIDMDDDDDNDMDDEEDNDMDDDDDNDMDDLDDLLEVMSKLQTYTSFEQVESFINRANEVIDNKTGGYEALEEEGKDLLDFVEDASEEIDEDNEEEETDEADEVDEVDETDEADEIDEVDEEDD
ncbi:anti-sigma factor domain-containing protein [Acidaminobacter sp. JC074]|uniref:anti-sigma factor domain-containing protein n=1 Tax=Acidaminobacter sp. JC074 TaxID=2530199 RepID=UPI001F0E87F4|nr:anti-sigma factor domain-containing protein [Acidaminobacter sp. JC074]MCH4889729.1 anti-sigma factor domain-containing protein [Acidaminobacter sp. JC074]